MRAFVTGGAGFIGSHLVERLIAKKYPVTVYDNFSSGKKEFLTKVIGRSNLKIIKGDVLDLEKLSSAIKNHGILYHFSANADVRKGLLKTDLDLKEGIISTYNVLEAGRKHQIKKIVFPSSMTVYGKANGSISETYGPCFPISLYGASKLSSESLISAFAHNFGMKAWILRFANVVGGCLTHGVIFDLINKLLKNNKELEVLGDGYQTKPYIHISDAVSAMSFIQDKANDVVNIFNVGVSDEINVREITKIIIQKMKLKNVKVKYQKITYGWKGDVEKFSLDISKLQKLDFKPKYSARKAIELAVEERLKKIKYLSS